MQTQSARPSQYSRRNYLLFIAEGGIFMGALNFTNHQTVLPSLILEQNGPGWLAALSSGLMVIGMFAAPIFTHRWVDRMQHYHRFTSFWFFLHRAVYLLAAWLLFQYSNQSVMVVAIIALTPFISGILGGVPLAAWQQLFMNAVPVKRRPSAIALRFLLGGLIGMIGGKVIEWTLADHPGPNGYARLHLWAGGIAVLSWVAFAFVRENPKVPTRPPEGTSPNPISHSNSDAKPADAMSSSDSASQNWLQILLHPDLRRFWIALFLMHFVQVLAPFYAVGIRYKFDLDISFLGTLSVWQMTGFTLGNFSAAYLGDKISGKWVFRYGMLAFAATLTIGAFAPSLLLAKIGYFAFGYFLIFMVVGKDAYILEIAPKNSRSLFLSMASFVSMLCMLVFSMISYFLWLHYESILVLALPIFILFPIAFFVVGKESPKTTDFAAN